MRLWCSRAVYDRKCRVPATLSAHQQHCMPTGRPLIRIWQVLLVSLFLLFSAEELAQMTRCWRSDSARGSQTHSSNRELRKGLSCLKEQLRNVFWLLIDCEQVINWAVIITQQGVCPTHGICVRQRERALNWDSVPSCHFLFTSFHANSRFEVVFWSAIAQQTPASVSREHSLLHINQF